MTTRRSAFPVRMSYKVNVRSEPMLARTDDSAMLKRTDVIVSVEVGNVRFETGALLRKKGGKYGKEIRKLKNGLCFVPYLDCVRTCGEERVRTVVVDRAGKVNIRTDYSGKYGTHLKAVFPGKTFNG